MKTTMIMVGLSLLGAATALADGPVTTIDWSQHRGPGTIGPPSADGPQGTLTVVGSTVASAPVIAVIDGPKVSGLRYRLVGRVRYREVVGTGYLELNNVIETGVYFTRSLAPAGPMGSISGSSDWRDFVLPFDATGGSKPTRLELKVVLPGPGVVELGRVELLDGFSAADSLEPGAAAIVWACLTGSTVVFSMVAAWVLVARGRARRREEEELRRMRASDL